MLRQCVYSSRTHLSDSAIDNLDILRAAGRRNAALGVTGFLVKQGPRFFGVLEGAPEALEAILARLATDRRHCDFAVDVDRMVTRRRFAGWSMEFLPGAGGTGESPSAEVLLDVLDFAARRQARKAPVREAS